MPLLDLEIADPAADLLVLGISGGIPERRSRIVLEGDQGCDPAGPAAAQILLASARQRDPDALPSMPGVNGKPIHVSSPAIPAGDQSAGDLIAALGDQESGRGICDQTLDVVQAVSRRCVLAPRLSP